MRTRSRILRGVYACSLATLSLAACSSKEDDAPGGINAAGSGGPGQAGSSASGGRTGTGGAAGNVASAGKPNGGGAGGSAGVATAGRAATGGSAGTVGRGGAATGGTSTGGAGDGGAAGDGTTTPTVCDGNCHYVRAGATGTGDGSSWDDAYTELPDALVRGGVYFVAAGTYPGYHFDDAEDGGKRTAVLRASLGDHGDGSGWSDDFAGGEAVFGELVFDSGDYDFDGRSALRAVGSFQGTVVDIEANSVTFAGVDVDGAFAKAGDMHSEGACTGVNVSGDDVTVRQNRVHDIADDGVVVSGSSRFAFEGNEISFLYGCGTDGGCGPCYNGHSDGLEIYALKDSTFVGNFAHDIQSTSTFFFGNWADDLGNGPADYCENILLANNVLYNPDTGFVLYIEDVRGVELYQNTIWGKHDGRYGGVAIGVDVTGLELVNNVILSVNYEHLGGAFDPAEHHGDYNAWGISLGQWQDAAHDIVALDPGFDAIPDGDGAKVESPVPADFTPKATSPLRGAGTSAALGALPSVDFFGKPRGSPPTLGAIE